jgi:hypothetical protein
MWRPGLILAVMAPLCVAGGVAAASALVPATPGPVGPENSRPADAAANTPGPRTPDPAAGRPWTVRTYASETGWTCVQAGQTDGNSFGRAADDSGNIDPLPLPDAGSCADLSEHAFAWWVDHHPAGRRGGPRAVIFGAVDRSIASVQLVPKAGESKAVPTANGAFVSSMIEPDMDGTVLRFVSTTGDVTDERLHAAPVPIQRPAAG